MAKKKVEKVVGDAPKKRGRKKAETPVVEKETVKEEQVEYVSGFAEVTNDNSHLEGDGSVETVNNTDSVKNAESAEIVSESTKTETESVEKDVDNKEDNKKGNLFRTFRNFFGYMWNGQIIDN